MTSEKRQRWRSVLGRTACDPVWLGHWLRRHRRTEAMTPARLAGRLGLSLEGLMTLSLCRTPREDHFQEDLDVVCRRTGADPNVLAHLLRQEQGLARWAGEAPQQGWLMAASDRPDAAAQEPPPDTTEGDPDES